MSPSFVPYGLTRTALQALLENLVRHSVLQEYRSRMRVLATIKTTQGSSAWNCPLSPAAIG